MAGGAGIACNPAALAISARYGLGNQRIASACRTHPAVGGFSPACRGADPRAANATCGRRNSAPLEAAEPDTVNVRPNPRPPAPGHASGAAKGSKCCARRLIQTLWFAETDDGRPTPGA